MKKGIFLGVLGTHIDSIEIFDERFEKPYISVENGNQEVVFQNIDKIMFEGVNFDIFKVNQVAINMKISKNSCTKAEEKLEEFRKIQDTKELDVSRYNRSFLIEKSKKLCDYLEIITEAIVFSYTAVEAFINLSIPKNYIYRNTKKEGYFEEYNSYGIQRHINLKEKIKKIICPIYKVDNLLKSKIWSDFCELEKIRNKVVHLKSDNYIELIEEFLTIRVFDYIKSANKLIEYIILNCDKSAHTIGNEHLWPKIDNQIMTIYQKDSILKLKDI